MSLRINFSLTQIEYVLAVHRFGHFAKAAEACHVTQPTLSMQLQKLEDTLGVTLFDRSKKPILLTAEGQRVIEQFKVVLIESKKIPALIVHSEASQTKGRLQLGVIPTVAPYILPTLLPKLATQYPDLELQIAELQTSQIVEKLQDDEIDVGILAIPLGLPKIHEHSLYFEPFQVLCKKSHSLAKVSRIRNRDLKSEDIWLLTEGHCLRNQMLDVCETGKKTKQKHFDFESGSLETLKSLVDSYGGYTLVPQMAAIPHGKQSLLIPFERPIPAREIGLVYSRRQYKSKLIEALAEGVLSCLPQEIRKLRPKDLEVVPVDER